MYPRDKYGSYKVTHRWIEAWRGQAPGFVENELREYENRTKRVYTSDAVYILDHPRMAAMH
jgi:hypothetical protein